MRRTNRDMNSTSRRQRTRRRWPRMSWSSWMAIVRRIVWVRIFELMFFIVIYYAGCKIEIELFWFVWFVGGYAVELCDKAFQIYLKTVSNLQLVSTHQQWPLLTTNPSAVSSNAHHPKCGSWSPATSTNSSLWYPFPHSEHQGNL